MNTCGLQDDIIMNKSCTDYIIVNKRVLTESACFKITNTPYFSVSLIFTVLSCFQELDESRRKTVKLPPPSATPHCQFCDVSVGTQCVTVLLENPVGCRVVEEGRKEEFARKLLQK